MRAKLILFFLALSYHYTCTAQSTFTNNGVIITNLDQDIYVKGSIINQADGFISNHGNIYINGDITNNAATSFSDSSLGQIHLNGTGQKINGTHSLNFHRLTLNTTDTLTLEQSIKVTDSLKFTSGYIHLNGQTIYLDSSGVLFNERHTSHIYGKSGKIAIQKYISNPVLTENIGGLGLRFKSNNTHGKTTIERTHYQQPAADSSIFRSYKISSQYPNLIDSISVSYFNDEIFKNESNYKIYSKKVSGNYGWINKQGTVDFVYKNVSTAGADIVDTVLFTIADQACSAPPDIHITGVSSLISLMTVDTITCSSDTLSVNAYSSATNAIIKWRDLLDSVYSNPLQVSSPNFFFIDVTNGINGCNNNILINITQNKTPPLLGLLSDTFYLNCSQPTVELNGTTPTPQTSLAWSGASYASPNPALVITPGTYVVTATRSDNGCTNMDSVSVEYQPKIILASSNDTLVCKNSNVNISATATGAVTNVNYVWSNGSGSASTIIQAITTTTYVVTATSPGCTGRDTVIVTVPTDIIDSVATYKPCNGTTLGTIMIYAYGGIPPHQFSIDSGSTLASAGNFPNTPYGTYNILIKDSLGCTKSNTAELNGLSNFPVAQFIASTKNTTGDTIILVDISSPQPDSVKWILPSNASIIGGDNFNPIIFNPDTGAFLVSMIGYFGECVIDTTKLIQFFYADSTIASEFNNNGIKSVVLYPNPNSGQFTVGVEFYKKQNSSIQVWDTSPSKYFQQNFIDMDQITLPINLTQLINGTYILRVIGEYNTKYSNFIITH